MGKGQAHDENEGNEPQRKPGLGQALHGRLAEGMAATLRRLESVGMEVFGDPRAGMFLWARLPGLEDAADLAARAVTEGIFLAPGKVFRPHQEPSPWLRFNVARCGDARLWQFLQGAT